ncbi:hypothetical protein B0G85_1522 [Polynucleobacter brandtiae]|uniref:Lipoprotein n=2 Tax=Polynucleobacter brandtiae TaxID=1938816 RepID=A0A2M8VQG5_9BURK|nr:hypothetical protein B0G85_1522 [Polynucleobacter brandtiae]
MEWELAKRVASYVVALLAATFFLTACSPKLDWRTVQSPQENYSALFPGKPEKLDRKIPYQGREIPQTLEAVKVDDDIYSVSATQLNQNQVEFLPSLLGQLQDNLFKRANVNLDSAASADAFYQTASRQKIAIKDYFLEFPSTGAIETSMRVRWITRMTPERGAWVYQISVLHTAPARVEPKKFFSEEAYLNFFDEFRPE